MSTEDDEQFNSEILMMKCHASALQIVEVQQVELNADEMCPPQIHEESNYRWSSFKVTCISRTLCLS